MIVLLLVFLRFTGVMLDTERESKATGRLRNPIIPSENQLSDREHSNVAFIIVPFVGQWPALTRLSDTSVLSLSSSSPSSSMKSLRRSLNNKDPSGGGPISPPVGLPPLQKPSSAMMPPKKVIRALQSYRPQAPQELGFQKGDFFYVVSEVNNGPSWYEAHNPVSGSRGLVPKSYFEEFQKTNAV